MTPEGRVKAVVRRHLAKLDAVWWFMPVQVGLGTTALDFLVCLAGTFVAIETKAERGRPTARQIETARRIASAGGLVFLVCSEEQADALGRIVLPAIRAGTYHGLPDELRAELEWRNDGAGNGRSRRPSARLSWCAAAERARALLSGSGG